MARRRKMDPERKAFINSLLEHYQRKRQIIRLGELVFL